MIPTLPLLPVYHVPQVLPMPLCLDWGRMPEGMTALTEEILEEPQWPVAVRSV